MILALLENAGLNPHTAARYLGVSDRTMRRWLQTKNLPKPAFEALRRARWIAPEAANYLEYLGVLRGIEHGRRSVPTNSQSG
jgi:excisionase family DNA binding protein